MDKFVQFNGGRVHASRRSGSTRPCRTSDRDGLLRRQHRHRALELRAALRDERQLVRHDLRSLDPGRAEPGLRPDARRHAGDHGGRVNSPTARSSAIPTRHVRRLLDAEAHRRRCTRTQHRRPAEPARTSPGAGSRAASRRSRAQRTARPSAARRTRTSAARSVTDYSPHHEPFQYYASTANPHHLPPTLDRA